MLLVVNTFFNVTLQCLQGEISHSMSVIVRTILLLTLSNVFMTFAWYGHLKNLNDRK